MDYLAAIRITMYMYTAVVSAISQLTIPMNIVNKCIQATHMLSNNQLSGLRQLVNQVQRND